MRKLTLTQDTKITFKQGCEMYIIYLHLTTSYVIMYLLHELNSSIYLPKTNKVMYFCKKIHTFFALLVLGLKFV